MSKNDHIDTWKNSSNAFEQQLQLNLSELNNYPQHWVNFIDFINEIKHKIDRIVDIGCGAGIYYKICQNHFPNLDYIGYDYAPAAVSLASKQWNCSKFINKDYKEITQNDLHPKDMIVDNALSNIMPDGDVCINTLLSLKCPYIILQRCQVSDDASYNIIYDAYDIKTYKFVHNKKNLFKMLDNHGYDILRTIDNTSLNILAERR
jgi:trans-aconitate methyltransferase